MKYSDAQKEATARYNKKTYERIDIVVKKGQRQILKDYAASQGKSLNRFVLDAVAGSSPTGSRLLFIYTL